MRFVITGTPGSGTRYMAKLLTDAGVETGHEAAMPAPYEDGRLRIGRSIGLGEVSWAAAPFLRHFDMPTVHLTRHPVKTISTLVSMKWGITYRDALARLVPGLFDFGFGPEQMAYYWLRWNAYAEDAEYRMQVEKPDIAVLHVLAKKASTLIGPEELRAARDSLATDIGHRTENYLTYDELGRYRDAVWRKAVEYGYED